MSLALFDLDNTLIAGDSDHSWGEFLVEKNVVDSISFKQQNDAFFEDYNNGALNVVAYLEFALAPLTTLSPTQLSALHKDFMQTKIMPLMLPKAQQLLEKHQQQGDTLVIITSTNSFITSPIAEYLNVPHLISSEAEHVNGRYTGKLAASPCFQEGKITCLQQWLEQHPHTLEKSYFYSDSINDLPLMKHVQHPVAVDPDPKLKAIALAHDWPVISLR